MADALTTPTSFYERDFHAWTVDQAAKLRARPTFDNRGDIDWGNAAEVIESAGDWQRSEIESRMSVDGLARRHLSCRMPLRHRSDPRPRILSGRCVTIWMPGCHIR